MNKRQFFFSYFFFLFFKLFLQLRQFTILQLRGFIQIILSLRFADLLIHMFDLFTNFLYPLNRMLFILPLYLFTGIFFFQTRQFFL